MTQSVEKQYTKLLPPTLAARIAWGMTGQFVNSSDATESKVQAASAEALLKDIQKRAAESKGEELEYVEKAAGTIRATMRTLGTIYKGRELNFQENERLRSVYLENFRENLEFGKSAKDFMKSLPTMAISTGTGVFVLAEVGPLQGWPLALIGLALAGVGYIINAGIVRLVRGKQQELYVREDYQRNLYYNQYISRTRTALVSLYLDVDRDHRVTFGDSYPGDPEDNAQEVVERLLKGVRHTMCPYVHKHMRERKITPELWHLCEVGPDASRSCVEWEDAASRVTGPVHEVLGRYRT